ncbi:MAG: S41 family peptidase [Defluviitaleaceae bacterium]|nr:S41 family peptidase [Defluviitaleaceae bacterium]
MSGKANYILGIVSGLALAVVFWVAFATFAPDAPAVGNTQNAAVEGLDATEIGRKLSHITQIINQHYIGEFDIEHAIDLMFSGFVYGAGDPYTSYMSVDAFTAFRETTDGEFGGIGVSIMTDVYDNRILVIAPFEGSPAFNAGILPGDKIIRVDGTEVFGGNGVNDAIRMMRGEEGTEVLVTIFRESDGTTFDVPLVRELIQTETVRGHVIDDNIGYLRISQFNHLTYNQFVTHYNRLMDEGINGLILDLRNNPGGLLNVVADIADIIIPEGIITFTEYADGSREYLRSGPGQIEIPLVVLVNGNSASASEILAGAVRDTGVGQLLGTTTFGKGLVQSIFSLNDGSALRVTVARYFTPAGISINGEGIEPEHYVEMSIELTNNLVILAQEADIQLQEAIKLMLQMVE